VKYGLITPEEYLATMSGKMNAADNFIDDVSFTDISLHMLDEYSNQFANVYQKGALIAMCLDIKLRSLSDGKYGMQNLMADLSKKYGKDKPFQDDMLFQEIGAMTYPEIATFLNSYVGGSDPLPFTQVLKLVGVSHAGGGLAEELSLGFGAQAFGFVDVEGEKKISIANMAGLTEQGARMGFEQGDILVAINSETIPDLGPETGAFLAKHKKNLKAGDTLSYTVIRKDASGAQKNIGLSAPIAPVKVKQKHELTFQADASPEQLNIRKAWLSAN
jgi:predicted metalloprotease with PDZ domain